MTSQHRYKRHLFVSISLTSMIAAAPLSAQTGAQTPSPASASADQDIPEGQVADIVVTGFRASLNNALNQKRNETAAVDSIVAEDIGKFPDSNLAESMQRIPGVALSRGDGGEGRNISVRGLGAQFTRVRINGMEGVSQVSGSDIRGGVATGRSFDFVTFPTEIFSALSVRKTMSADVEEGSLGATVDLRAPRPFDQKKDFVFSGTARGIYNDIKKDVDPRLSALFSKKFGDTFGILGSIAYSKRHIDEYAYSAADVVPTYVYGLEAPSSVPRTSTDPLIGSGPNRSLIMPFCTPVGYTYRGVAVNSPSSGYSQSNGTPIGADANNCSTNNPRTGNAAAYDYIMSRVGANGRPGGGVFLPRLPRPVKSSQEQQRIAGSLTLQWKPTDLTDISIDGLYSRFKVNRLDTMFDARSFGRALSNNGQPLTSVREIEVDDNGSLIHGLFDGVDLRSEMQDERFTSEYKQVNLNIDHRFSDTFRVFGLAGINRSELDVNRLQVAIDSNDTRNWSIDFRDNPDIPKIGYGIDTTNPAVFQYGPPLATGDQRGQLSNFIRRNTITSKTFELNTEWKAAPGFTVQVGGQYRTNEYVARERQLTNTTPLALPAGVSVSDFTFVTSGIGKNLDGQLQDFVAVDPDKFRRAVNFDTYSYCNIECARGTYGGVSEKYSTGYLMFKFDTSNTLPFALRGDAGVRYVHTKLDTYGPITAAAPAGAPFASRFVISEVGRSYDDWLPSMNLALDVTPDLIARFSASRVMSRPSYGQLIPAGSANLVIQTASFSNPFLEPIRANTFDASLEWYFAPGSLISLAYFYKNIESYIQTTSTSVAFQDIGLPLSLLSGTLLSGSDQFTVQRSNNTPGGPLRGFEVNVQLPFRFLPGALSNFGALANFTRVRSNINYIISPTLSRTAPLVGLSPETASGTLYYEDSKFSIRSTVNYRSSFLTAVPSGSVDADSTANASSIFVDASASYNLTENIKLIAEVSNITNETNRLTVDTVRQDPLYTAYFGRTYALAINFQL
ncbi:TonB-dependent receptor [Sphingomonas phyllosphaerae]|uniref:TonB-dependent receptor n=1 Tax=Sphingomonas phyllosphaerae TaxID=257003 RepID=UPI0004288CA0|nr:TonB-dependent receptor [Sphingomonas phyllosphaerae]